MMTRSSVLTNAIVLAILTGGAGSALPNLQTDTHVPCDKQESSCTERALRALDGTITLDSSNLYYPIDADDATTLQYALDRLTTVSGDDFSDHAVIQNRVLNSFRLSSDGTNMGVFVDSADQVGISTTTPVYTLDVAGSANASAAIKIGVTDVLASKSDPTVGALGANKWCSSDGLLIHCVDDRLRHTGTDPTVPRTAGQLQLPLVFESNEGQAAPQVQALGRGPGTTALFLDSSVVFRLTDAGAARELRLVFPGSEPRAVRPEGRLPGRSNYFIGNDPQKWRSNVAHYGRVRYSSLYPGIDVVFYGNGRQFEYDFVVHPHADPSRIRLDLEGADRLEITPGGLLVAQVGDSLVLQHQPLVYQEEAGVRTKIESRYTADRDGGFGIKVAEYRKDLDLVIDPTFQFSSFLGGNEDPIRGERAAALVVGTDRGVFLAGDTSAADFPVISQIAGAANDSDLTVEHDAWVAKVHRSGNFLEWSTFIGGAGIDGVNDIVLDEDGDVYIVGESSILFPEVGALPVDDGDMFVAKISGSGSALLFSSRFGGDGDGIADGVAVDSDEYLYVAGKTTAEDFPTTPGAFQETCNMGDPPDDKCTDAFVMKIDLSVPRLLYSTYFGGTGVEWARDMAIDAKGFAYLTGETSSDDLPTLGAFQDSFGGGGYDCFVTKLGANGDFLTYSTYLGSDDLGAGSSSEGCRGIDVDSAGRAWVTGNTWSTSFPLHNALQGTFGGGSGDAFVTGLDATGANLVFSTLLGGDAWESGAEIVIDSAGYIYVGGKTISTSGFPLVNEVQSTCGGCVDPWGDAFVTVYTPDGAGYLFSTYLGGESEDFIDGLDVDGFGEIYVCGGTSSGAFPVVYPIDFGPYSPYPVQDQRQGTWDSYITKIGGAFWVGNNLALSVADNADPVQVGDTLTYSFTLENEGPADAYNAIVEISLEGILSSVTYAPSQGSCAAGKCNFGTLPAFTSATVKVTASVEGLGTASAIGFGYCDVTDSDTSDNWAGESTAVNPGSDLWPDPLEGVFLAAEVGKISQPTTFTITNSIAVNRTLGQLSFGGGSAAEFALQNDACSFQMLAPGADCTVGVVLVPISPGERAGSLEVPSDDTAFPVLEVPLTGSAYLLGAPTVLLSRTGQTASYAPGDDGDIKAGVAWPNPRFVDNGDGTITDMLTGLMWLKQANCTAVIGVGSSLGEIDWQGALDFVAGINSGAHDISSCSGYTQSYTDWHLPNVSELRSLIQAEPTGTSVDILVGWGFEYFLPITNANLFWSSTTSTRSPAGAFNVHLAGPRVGSSGKTNTYQLHALPVRLSGLQPVAAIVQTGQTKCYQGSAELPSCLGTGQDGEIRAGIAPPPDRFVDHGDGTVSDRLTGLMWSKSADPWDDDEADWQDALDSVAALNSASYLGRNDWRLPNSVEMGSLADYGMEFPALPGGHPFELTGSERNADFWTGTAGSSTNRLATQSVDGSLRSLDATDTNTNYYWPVRDGIIGAVNFADVKVSVEGTPDPVDLGATLIYSIIVENDGPDEATAVSLVDNIPASAMVQSATAVTGNCSTTGNLVTCDLGTLVGPLHRTR